MGCQSCRGGRVSNPLPAPVGPSVIPNQISALGQGVMPMHPTPMQSLGLQDSSAPYSPPKARFSEPVTAVGVRRFVLYLA